MVKSSKLPTKSENRVYLKKIGFLWCDVFFGTFVYVYCKKESSEITRTVAHFTLRDRQLTRERGELT